MSRSAVVLVLLLLATACGSRRAETPPEDPPYVSTRAVPEAAQETVQWPQQQVVYYATDRAPHDLTTGWHLEHFLWAGLVLVIGRLLMRSMRKIVAPPYQWRVTVTNWVLGIAVVALAYEATVTCLRESALHRRVGLCYGSSREKSLTAADGRLPLNLGVLEVSIPMKHKRGVLERPSAFKGEIFENPDEHIMLVGTWKYGESEFFTKVKEKAGDHDILVFVHGYNTSFEEAALRAAQIAWDADFLGAPILYSWPSAGAETGYLKDAAAVAWTVPHLERFLKRLAKETPGPRIHLLAHSMGNRALTEVLRRLGPNADPNADPKAGPNAGPFREVVLAAPDIDADTFRQDLANAIKAPDRRIHLYASDKDEALVYAKTVHGAPRAGQAGSSLVIVKNVEGRGTIDTIDVSEVTAGHSYIGNDGRVLHDLREILDSVEKFTGREEQRHAEQLPYWLLKARKKATVK